jgi:hypothetical protein
MSLFIISGIVRRLLGLLRGTQCLLNHPSEHFTVPARYYSLPGRNKLAE